MNTVISTETETTDDPFKKVPYRYLGYANEVGEAFRHVVPVRVVHCTYLIASGYVLAHAAHQGHQTAANHKIIPCHGHSSPTVAVADTIVWQGLASVAIPGLVINRVCALSKWLLQTKTALNPRIKSWSIIAIGLGAIPIIIHPIDSFVDKLMDYTIRPVYS